MTSIKPKRIEEIDILKGIAIILMVVGHAGAPYKFIFLFHMAVFMIASGFTYKSESSDSLADLGRSILKKIRRLWFPYFFWSSVGTLLNNFLIHANILTDNPELFTYTSSIKRMGLSTLSHIMGLKEMILEIAEHGMLWHTSVLVNSMWFVKTLFLISILYMLVDWFVKRCLHKNPMAFQAVISIILLGIGYYLQFRKLNLMGLNVVASYYHLYFIGSLLSRYRNLYANWRTKQFLPAMLVSLGILIVLRVYGHFLIDLARNSYPNPFLFLVASLSGWVFCYSASYFLKLSPLKRFMLYIGKRTMSILLFHVLSFKIVNAIIISTRHLPAFCLAARPHLYGDQHMLWVAFTFVGIACPLLLNLLYEKIKLKLPQPERSAKQ